MNANADRTTVNIVDTTLRDGEQSAGIVFSCEEKILMAKALSDIGIREMEVGIPAIGEFEIDCIRKILDLNLDCRLIAWCRAYKQDIDAAYRTGVKAVHISLPVSIMHLAALDKNEDWVIENLHSQIRYAKKRFEFVSSGAQDAGRSDGIMLREFIRIADEEKADRIRIADTVGILGPSRTYDLVSTVRSLTGMSVEFHAHNDLGMATANSVTAVQAGADSVSVTVNGLGERAGNTPLEEFVMAIMHTPGIKCSIDNKKLFALCRMTAGFSGRPIPVNKPVTGDGVFRHESGIHCMSLLSDRNTYELIHPEDIGRTGEEFVIGKHSGRAGLMHVMKKNGIGISESEASVLLDRIKKSSVVEKRSLNMDEIRRIYHEIEENK